MSHSWRHANLLKKQSCVAMDTNKNFCVNVRSETLEYSLSFKNLFLLEKKKLKTFEDSRNFI